MRKWLIIKENASVIIVYTTLRHIYIIINNIIASINRYIFHYNVH